MQQIHDSNSTFLWIEKSGKDGGNHETLFVTMAIEILFP